jgi:hypothetical protein
VAEEAGMFFLNLASIDNPLDLSVLIGTFLALGTLCAIGVSWFVRQFVP